MFSLSTGELSRAGEQEPEEHEVAERGIVRRQILEINKICLEPYVDAVWLTCHAYLIYNINYFWNLLH